MLRLPIKLKVQWPREPDMADVRLPPPTGWTNTTICNYSMQYEPELSRETDRLGIVLLLRNMVYHRCPSSPTPAWININPLPDANSWLNFNTRFADCVVNQTYGHECQGRVYLYMMALKAFGIPFRSVSMWKEKTGLTPASLTHAALDVFVKNKWIGIDLHFNRSVRNATTGQRISYRDAQVLIGEGGSVTLDYDGFDYITGLTFEDYVPSMADLLQYMVVGISSGVTAAVPYAMTGTWDGILNYTASGAFDAKASSEGPVYQALV